MNLDHISSEALELASKAGLKKSQVSVDFSEVQEFELSGSDVNLCRTNNSVDIKMKAVSDGRQGSVSTNRWTEDSKSNFIESLRSGVESSEADEAFDIYQSDLKKSFPCQETPLDAQTALDRVRDLARQARENFPKLSLRSVTFQIIRSQSLLANSNGMCLKQGDHFCTYSSMFSGQDGEKTGSFNYVSNSSKKIPENLLNEAGLSRLFDFSSREVDAQAFNEEVKGDVILSPFVLPELMGFFMGQISTSSLISGSSLFAGKKGERVLSEKLSFKSLPFDSRFASHVPYSSEGVLYKDGFIFNKGVLENYMLDIYGANKLKERPTEVSLMNSVVEPGAQSFDDMIKGVKKGLLLMRCSGGSPSANGDFSGVAKNSFLIENGQITKPVNEVMISVNLVDLFSRIEAVSSDVINTGFREMPWIKTSI